MGWDGIDDGSLIDEGSLDWNGINNGSLDWDGIVDGWLDWDGLGWTGRWRPPARRAPAPEPRHARMGSKGGFSYLVKAH